MDSWSQLLSIGAIISGVAGFYISVMSYLRNTPSAELRRQKRDLVRAIGWTSLLSWMHIHAGLKETETATVRPGLKVLREYLGRLKAYLERATELGLIARVAAGNRRGPIQFAEFEMSLTEVVDLVDDDAFFHEIYAKSFVNGIIDLCHYSIEVGVFPRSVTKLFSSQLNEMKKYVGPDADSLPRRSNRKLAGNIATARRDFGIARGQKAHHE